MGKSLKGKELGWRKLSQLNLVILQDAFNQLATDTMREDCKSLLVDMLNRAVETELLNKNIAYISQIMSWPTISGSLQTL